MVNDKITSRKRYTLATRDIDLESLLVTGVLIVLIVIWACVTQDKRILVIPLFLLVVSFIAFISLLFRFFTEPKIAIQADCNGIYFYYRNRKEIYIDYKDMTEITTYCLYGRGRAVAKCGIVIVAKNNRYKSISIMQSADDTLNIIRTLVNTNDKEEYLMSIKIKQK